jgi:hypothetical protein
MVWVFAARCAAPAEDAALFSALARETKRIETRPMTRRSRWLLVVILGGIGLAAGLSLALGHPSKYGPAHSCPAGASRSACTYPPSLGLQRTEWSVAGLVLGLILAAAIIYVVSRGPESDRARAQRRVGPPA